MLFWRKKNREEENKKEEKPCIFEEICELEEVADRIYNKRESLILSLKAEKDERLRMQLKGGIRGMDWALSIIANRRDELWMHALKTEKSCINLYNASRKYYSSLWNTMQGRR
ncbi:MAG: hypothetical protein DRP41_02665 [Thermodesulfobacteriota bacterium]|nr:MAG: hypothetical protein DRP41_02665 [Thermodesulfobacteriota bacterium]